MKTLKELEDFVDNGYQTHIPHISLDCAIFGYHDHQLKILLTSMKAIKGFCLPGGYIRRTETLDEAAERLVQEKTGISGLYLQQYNFFGDPDRIKWTDFDVEKLSKEDGFSRIRKSWLMDQTVSIGYYAITDFLLVQPRPDFFSSTCEWRDIDKMPNLLYDHNEIVK